MDAPDLRKAVAGEHDAALAWAEAVLGKPIVGWVELPGGMTSTMIALRDDAGVDSVLRLMTVEPWRTHGAGLTRRERAAASL